MLISIQEQKELQIFISDHITNHKTNWAGGSKGLTETDVRDTSDVDHFDEIDIDMKLEEADSDDPEAEEVENVIPIESAEALEGL